MLDSCRRTDTVLQLSLRRCRERNSRWKQDHIVINKCETIIIHFLPIYENSLRDSLAFMVKYREHTSDINFIPGLKPPAPFYGRAALFPPQRMTKHMHANVMILFLKWHTHAWCNLIHAGASAVCHITPLHFLLSGTNPAGFFEGGSVSGVDIGGGANPNIVSLKQGVWRAQPSRSYGVFNLF